MKAMKTDFARRQMVAQQVRSWNVSDASVLQVLSELQREQFVPAGFEDLAFADTQIPLPHGQAMMAPIVEGSLLQALQLEPRHNVLEIGTGTGFLTACLAKLSAAVTSVDIFSDFIAMAKSNLADAAIDNIELMCMDATKELPTGQFDAIAITGSLPVFDTRFVDAVKTGGRLFVVVGDPPVMEARIVTRTGENDWTTSSLFETDLQPLLNAARPSPFSF
jgi:protein-L-isoaspartate(D-aspartate) O-methyltransferase